MSFKTDLIRAEMKAWQRCFPNGTMICVASMEIADYVHKAHKLTTHMDSATIATFAEAYDNQLDILPPKKLGDDASGSNLYLASR